ncbi:MAG: hypothetical protein DME17_16080 [Candidatus Rokuibacteriota bacterium]|nr:MAG: hypothetical protein DME17_16080 [Candidatus Rokubacteria bacterium]
MMKTLQAGVRTLNVVRRPEVAADLVELGADAVEVSGPDLVEQLAAALGNHQISLVLDGAPGRPPRRGAYDPFSLRTAAIICPHEEPST